MPEIPCGAVLSVTVQYLFHWLAVCLLLWAAGGAVSPQQLLSVDSFQPPIATDCMAVPDQSNGFYRSAVDHMPSMERISPCGSIFVLSSCVPLSLTAFVLINSPINVADYAWSRCWLSEGCSLYCILKGAVNMNVMGLLMEGRQKYT